MLAMPFQYSASLIILVAFMVTVSYCLDALYSERRDRSILFWKSLPVSDVTTVVSKALVPLVVTPVLTVAIVVTLQVLILLPASVVLAVNGLDAAMLWTETPILHLWAVLLYSVAALTLWYAPLYGWLLLCSAWAKRAPFMWAVLPPLAIIIVEAGLRSGRPRRGCLGVIVIDASYSGINSFSSPIITRIQRITAFLSLPGPGTRPGP